MCVSICRCVCLHSLAPVPLFVHALGQRGPRAVCLSLLPLVAGLLERCDEAAPSLCQSVSQSISQSVCLSVGLSVGRSVGLSV